MQSSVSEKGSRRRFGLLPILAAVIFMIVGLGLTCQEYAELPAARESSSPTYNVRGSWPAGLWFIHIKGDAAYDVYYLGGLHVGVPNPLLKKAGWYEIMSVAMRIGAFNPDLWLLEAQPTGDYQFLLSAKADIYGYNDATDDWDKKTAESLLGVHYNEGAMLAGEECSPDEPSGPFQPPEDWRVFCGEVQAVSASGAASVHAQNPYGELHLNITNSGCSPLPGFCDSEHWKHRIP